MNQEREPRNGEGSRMRLYMLFPFVLFLAAFLLDKAFFLGDLPSYFMNTASFVNFQHKEELVDQLEEYLHRPDHKKVLVVFGNSRTLSFDNDYFEKKYPGWILFNFSVPGGTSDFFLYHMEKFQKRDLHPDFIYFAVTPQGFNTTPGIAMDEVLVFGLPPLFVARYMNRYSSGELTNYLAKSLFWTYKNKPRIGRILKRSKNDSRIARDYRKFVEHTWEEVRKERGSVPQGLHQIPRHESEDFLVQDARSSFRTFLAHFTLSKGQVRFTEDLLRITHEMKIPSALLWARVAPELRRLKKEEPIHLEDGTTTTIIDIWKPEMEKLVKKYDSDLVDMNYEHSISCDLFYDASHMAGICYHEFIDFLMERIRDREGHL